MHGEAGRVCLLKCVATDRRCGDLPGDGDDRRRIHQGVLQWSDQIGRSGPGGSHHHAHQSSGLGKALGHVPGALLVPGQHMPYWTVKEGVVGGENGTSGHAENDLDPFVLEATKERV